MVDEVNEAYFGKFPEKELAPDQSELRTPSRGVAPARPDEDRTEPLKGDVESRSESFRGGRGKRR
jgi:hypothetical protein